MGRRRLYNAKQVSQMTATALRTLYKWQAIESHPFPKAVTIGDIKGLRWDAQEVDDYLDGQFEERDEKAAAIRNVTRIAAYRGKQRKARQG